MKKLIVGLFVSVFILINAHAQDFTLTNTYVLSNSVSVVQTYSLNLIPVVSSAGAPLTNSSQWGRWIPQYITNNVYTNGITVSNSTVKVLWGEPKYQLRGIYQGNPPVWNGTSYTYLNIAVERILAGERLHVLIGVTDNSVTNLLQSTNVIYNASGVLYKVIEIPKTKPPGY